MSRIYLPTTGSHDWQWLLASPGTHWKHGASAMALADAWENAEAWPTPVAKALETNSELAGADLLLALPEHVVPLPGGSRASQIRSLRSRVQPASGLGGDRRRGQGRGAIR